MRLAGRIFALGLLMCGAGCAATGTPRQIVVAINRMDPEALRSAARRGNEAERQLAVAVQLAWLRRDEQAAVELRKSADALRTPSLRMQALKTLSEVQFRTGDYAEATATRRQAVSVAAVSDSSQLSQFAPVQSGLADTPPMTLSGKTRGSTPVRIDDTGLPRTTVSFANQKLEAVLDTGASLSAISESAARRLGLSLLPGSVEVRSGAASTPSRLAVADEISIGEARFQHVVFAVVPDNAMTFSQGQYKLDVVIGLPVFLKLGRIAILPQGGEYVLIFGASGLSPGERPNLLLDGLRPIVAGTLGTTKPAPVSLLLDSGATQTSFTNRISPLVPNLVAAAPVVQSVRSAIGADMAASNARLLGPLPLTVGGLKLVITDAKLRESAGGAYHGILGQDLLKVGFIADFDAMTFELGPQSRGAQ